MMVARSPHFVEQETVGRLDGAVQVVGDAAIFAAGGRDEGAEFRSRKDSWPGLARRITTRVTAFFGSLALACARAWRFAADFFALRFAMMAGLYSKRRKEKYKTVQALVETAWSLPP